jgi:hypothetical protein
MSDADVQKYYATFTEESRLSQAARDRLETLTVWNRSSGAQEVRRNVFDRLIS